MPAQPAPTTSTSCLASTREGRYPIGQPPAPANGARGLDARAGLVDPVGDPLELLEVLAEEPRELARLRVVGVRIRPRRARFEELRVHARHLDRDLEAEDRILAVVDV